MTELEIKYIGWNMGQYGKERHETKSSIELLELKIDGVDVLKQIEDIKTSRNNLYDALPIGEIDAFDLIKVIKKHITELDKSLGVD